MAADLDEKEQGHVRVALKHLRRAVGGWVPLSRVLGFQPDTLEKVANARGRAVTASMAIRVTRLVGVPLDELISGRYLPGACPRCGHRPDFSDEPTTVDDEPRTPIGRGLKLVK